MRIPTPEQVEKKSLAHKKKLSVDLKKSIVEALKTGTTFPLKVARTPEMKEFEQVLIDDFAARSWRVWVDSANSFAIAPLMESLPPTRD